ncbi:hypothetical protein MBLL_00827 (plasmid) [Methylobacterium bullatum]|uniref:Uncharacterized protein n=1 Tax=Methylobacterium bullatum TaxID=570505 RepID=A0A679JJU8_9HYPH|nr:hypothetical protein MBLL_00827 [Methylobacterium bullatum]
MLGTATNDNLPEGRQGAVHLIKAACLGVAKTWRAQGNLLWPYSKARIVTADLIPLEPSP